jgi:hypothetical protein
MAEMISLKALLHISDNNREGSFYVWVDISEFFQ